MAAVGQHLTQATHPTHVSSVSTHSEQSRFALTPKQASGFTTLTFPLLTSKTNDGHTETHTPQPSHNSKSICTLGISSLPCLISLHLPDLGHSPLESCLPETTLIHPPNFWGSHTQNIRRICRSNRFSS